MRSCSRQLLQERNRLNVDTQVTTTLQSKVTDRTHLTTTSSYAASANVKSCSRQWITAVRGPLSAYTSSLSNVSQEFGPSRKHIRTWHAGPHSNLSSRSTPSPKGVARWFTWRDSWETTKPLVVYTSSLTATFTRTGYTFRVTFFKIVACKICTEIWRTAACISQAS